MKRRRVSRRRSERPKGGGGGGSGIRTHGGSRLNRFQGGPVRPLRHPSDEEATCRSTAVEAGDRAQHVGHDERAVLLVVLPQEDERAADRARGAVQRVHEPAAAARLHPGVEPAGREVAVVRARRELAVSPFRRAATPRGRTSWSRRRRDRRPRCSRRGTGDPGPRRCASSIASRRSCSSSDASGCRPREHLDLVELVDAEDAARVLAVRPRLAAEAGREAAYRAGSAPSSKRSPRCNVESGTSLVPTRNSSPPSTSYTWLRSVGKNPASTIVSSRTSTGGITGVNPSATSRLIIHCTSASSTSTASRRSDAKREPLVSAA